MPPIHADSRYEAELTELRERISKMGRVAGEMIANSIEALVERDSALAHAVIERDAEMDRLEVGTDELCLHILSRREPVATDLRFVTMTLKIIKDLERIGDLAVNASERAIELNQEPPLGTLDSLVRMAEVSGGMVALALQAFLAGDANKAHEVIGRERTADALYAEVFRQFLSHMMEDVHNVQRATRVQAVAKYLERIADHATNVAELVIFMVKGQDIRHGGEILGRRVPHGVLFLCLHNSARSQMAEGWARQLFEPGVHVGSAGSQPAPEVNSYAVRVMQEVGIDISQQRPKHISDVALGDVDTVITLCEEEVCEDLPGILRRETWAFPDVGKVSGSEDEIEDAFRRVRDGIRARIDGFLKAVARPL